MNNFNVSTIEKLWGEKLDSSLFTWLNHVGTCGTSSTDILNLISWNGSLRITNPRYDIVGWCYGSNLTVRPRADALGVMFWDNEQKQEIWCHVSKTLNIIFCVRMKIDKSLIFQV